MSYLKLFLGEIGWQSFQNGVGVKADVHRSLALFSDFLPAFLMNLVCCFCTGEGVFQSDNPITCLVSINKY